MSGIPIIGIDFSLMATFQQRDQHFCASNLTSIQCLTDAHCVDRIQYRKANKLIENNSREKDKNEFLFDVSKVSEIIFQSFIVYWRIIEFLLFILHEKLDLKICNGISFNKTVEFNVDEKYFKPEKINNLRRRQKFITFGCDANCKDRWPTKMI